MKQQRTTESRTVWHLHFFNATTIFIRIARLGLVWVGIAWSGEWFADGDNASGVVMEVAVWL